MEPLQGARILRAWEAGQGRSRQEQALALLAAAGVEDAPERLARLPLGRRDARLLELRARSLGPELEASARCPACSVTLYFSVAVGDLLAAGGQPAPAASPAADPGAGPRELSRDGFLVRYRLPDSRDLAAAGETTDPASARRTLLARCVVEARKTSPESSSPTPEQPPTELPAAALPDSVVAALAEALEAADPLAVIPLDLTCEACSHRWLPLLDPARFLWREIAGRAERLMHEVTTLALAFGWSEGEILAMGEARRHRYLELAPGTRSSDRPGADPESQV